MSKNMKAGGLKLHEQFITDRNGKKTAVVLNFAEYKELLEEHADILAMLKAQNEPPIAWEDAKKDLRKHGLL